MKFFNKGRGELLDNKNILVIEFVRTKINKKKMGIRAMITHWTPNIRKKGKRKKKGHTERGGHVVVVSPYGQ